MDYFVAVEGLTDLDVEAAPAKIRRFASQAINRALRTTRTRASRMMRDQIAFTARYLDSKADGRLRVAVFSKPGELEGRIRGRDRPTSLAQFTKQKPRQRGGPRPRQGGVKVTVKPGTSNQMDRAFLINLRNNNVGLAVRTSGGPPAAAYKPKEIGRNLYLLYGPSVDQVFRTVAQEVAPGAAAEMEAEFLRLSEALL